MTRVLGIARERRRGERRVAATPGDVATHVKDGWTVRVAHGAGEGSGHDDASYAEAGAELVDDEALWGGSDVVLKVGRPSQAEARLLAEGAGLICMFDGDHEDPVVKLLAARGCSLLAIDAAPRTTLAQAMDVRSSMASLAGYRAVVEAAAALDRPLGAQSTAAGATPPAKVLVIGAGVAGLAAIAAARGLGAEVRAFDTRAAAADQVRSLGGTFLFVDIDEDAEGAGGYAKQISQEFIDAEMALFREQATEIDVVITTALIPGRPAPELWMPDMVETMRTGSVVVDMAAPQGGNCKLTEPGKTVVKHGVTLVGDTDLTQPLAGQASRMLGKNYRNLLRHVADPEEGLTLDLEELIAQQVTVVQAGEVRWPAPPPPRPQAPPKKEPPAPPPPRPEIAPAASLPPAVWIPGVFLGVLLLLAVGTWAPASFLQHLTVFVLACFVGWQVVWNVTPALHTPLMSVTNAISGIIIVGGILQLAAPSALPWTLGFVALVFASINVFGGFAVTARMLAMFRRDGGAA